MLSAKCSGKRRTDPVSSSLQPTIALQVITKIHQTHLRPSPNASDGADEFAAQGVFLEAKDMLHAGTDLRALAIDLLLVLR